MSLDNGLLSTDGAMASQKSSKLKVVGCIVLAVAGTVMLGAAFSRLNTSNDEMVALSFAAPRVGAMRGQRDMSVQAAQDTLKMYGIGSSPLERIAIGAIDMNNRRQMGRDVSVKAAKEEMISGWNLVDPKQKRKILEVLEEVKYKESLLAGVTAPMNYFDPLGFSTTVTAGKLLFYREVELKHGRVAMLASLGIIVGELYHPLFGGNIDSPAAFAFQETPLQQFWPAVVAAIAIPEVYSVFTFQDPLKGEQWAIKEDHQPGDLGYDPLGLKPEDPTQFKIMQTRELNNGRLAMLGAAGMLAQEYVTGQKIF